MRQPSHKRLTQNDHRDPFSGRPGGSTGTSHARRCVCREGTARRARVPPIDYRDGLLPCLTNPRQTDINGYIQLRYDLIVIDELGYLPFSQPGGQLLFHLISKLYENTSLLITTNLAFADWPQVFGDAKMTTAMLVRIPTIATTDSDGSRPPVPIDRDQCGAGACSAVGC